MLNAFHLIKTGIRLSASIITLLSKLVESQQIGLLLAFIILTIFRIKPSQKKITIEFERVRLEDQCAFSINTKNASQETENYAYEIIGRVLDRFKGNKIT